MRVGEGDGALAAEVDGADEALNRFLPPDVVPGAPREHRVTALVLARDGQTWLPRTLAGLSAQERRADKTVGIDVRSTDDGRTLLDEALDVTIEIGADDSPIAQRRGVGLAEALAAGVGAGHADSGALLPAGLRLAEVGQDSADEVVEWYWILHDDSAPEPPCLMSLLMGADRNPGAAVLIPKTVAWSDRGRLVGVGTRWAPGHPVVNPLDTRERDQGQYDVDRPVYSGDSAGMLVRADAWHALSGLDPVIGDWAATADLCRRVWGSGAEVFFVPSAVVAHRQAIYRAARSRRDAATRARRAQRSGQLILELSQAPAWVLPWRTVRAWVTSALRLLLMLLTREPEVAGGELAGAWQVLGHPRAVLRARRRLRAPPVTDVTRPAHVRARRGAAITQGRDRLSKGWRDSSVRLGWPPPGRVWRPLAVAGVLAVLAFAREPGHLVGSGTLSGGGLLPAPAGLELLGSYLTSWQDVRFGTAEPLPAYLPLLAGASLVTLGSVDLLLRLAFGLAVPLAFLSAYLSLGGQMADRRYRAAAALSYALLPAAVAATGGGRISTLAVLLLGPPTVRLIGVAFSRAKSGQPGIRSELAAGTMLGIVVAFAPMAYGVALCAGLVGWLVLRLARWPVRTALGILAVAGLFLALWVPRLLRTPWLMLTEMGVNDPSQGSPEAWVWGLAPGGPTSVPWAGVPLLVVAAVVMVLTRLTPPVLGLFTAAVGLLAAAALLAPVAASWWSGLPAGTWWPGVLLVLAGGLFVLLIARQAAQDGRVNRVISAGWMVAVLALAGGWWVAPSTVEVSTGSAIPAVVSLDADSPARPRSLVLRRVDGVLNFAVSTAARPTLGDADAVAGQPVDPGFAEAVAGLMAGAGAAVEQELGGRAIRYVVFDGPPEDPVVTELDATVGLRQLARAPDQSLWLVAGNPTRAELAAIEPAADEEPPTGPVEVPVLTVPSSIDVVIHPQTELPRRLLLAERADSGWWATAGGEDLQLEVDPQGMVRATLADSGDLRMGHRSYWPLLAVGQLLIFVVLGVLALPKRRPMDPVAREDGA